jgi:hypothetical protein
MNSSSSSSRDHNELATPRRWIRSDLIYLATPAPASRPERVQPLIEAVYAPSPTIIAAVRAILHDRHLKAEGAALAALERGRDNRLSFAQGLLADWAGAAVQPESDAERLSTRLGDSRRAVLLERCGTSLRLLVVDRAALRYGADLEPPENRRPDH